MTLKKAIEIISFWSKLNCPPRSPEEVDALKILIEAGKRVIWHKGQHLDGYYELLPGETKE